MGGLLDGKGGGRWDALPPLPPPLKVLGAAWRPSLPMPMYESYVMSLQRVS